MYHLGGKLSYKDICDNLTKTFSLFEGQILLDFLAKQNLPPKRSHESITLCNDVTGDFISHSELTSLVILLAILNSFNKQNVFIPIVVYMREK